MQVVYDFREYLESRRRLDHSSRVTIPELTNPFPKPQFIDGILGFVTADRSYLVLVNPQLSSFPVIDTTLKQAMEQSPEIIYGTDFSGSKYSLEWQVASFTWDMSQNLLVLFPHGPDRRYVTCLVMKSFLFVLPLF
jgi:hypothetical protein